MRKTIPIANLIACFRAAAARIGPKNVMGRPDLYISCLVGALEDESQELANALYEASGQGLRDEAKWAAKDKAPPAMEKSKKEQLWKALATSVEVLHNFEKLFDDVAIYGHEPDAPIELFRHLVPVIGKRLDDALELIDDSRYGYFDGPGTETEASHLVTAQAFAGTHAVEQPREDAHA